MEASRPDGAREQQRKLIFTGTALVVIVAKNAERDSGRPRLWIVTLSRAAPRAESRAAIVRTGTRAAIALQRIAEVEAIVCRCGCGAFKSHILPVRSLTIVGS